MSTWVYFAAQAQANQADTIGFATRQNVFWRSARNSVGNLIANVGNLQPGDTILLVYRHGHLHVARARAKIAEVTRPVPGTTVIERLDQPNSQYLLDAGYRQVDDNGAVEVIHLEDVTECEIVLQGAYAGRGTIHRLAPEDANEVALLPGSEPDTEPEEHSAPADVVSAVVPVQGQAPSAPIGPSAVPATDDPEVAAIRRPDTAGRPLFDA